MRSLADRVRHTLRRHGLADRASRVLAALSGGPDSVALTHVLKDLAGTGAFALVGLAHFNHQLRETAGRDETFCRELAERLGLPLVVESADIRAVAARHRSSIEDAARDARYAFLDRAAARLGADRVAVGHTRDDQAETFLLRLLRGAGPRGLAGIYPRARLVIRPLIETTRAEVIEYLTARGLTYCDDETNRDLRNPRNRVRHELLPYLRQHFSPDIVSVLAREAAVARDDAAYLERAATEAEGSLVSSTGDNLRLDVEGLRGQPPAMARRIVRRALGRLAPERFIGFDHVEAVLTLLDADDGDGLDLPGQRAERAGGRIVLRPQDASAQRAGVTPTETSVRPVVRPLPIPGEAALPELGWVVTAELGEARQVDIGGLSAGGLTVVVDAAAVARPLRVRTRRPGDRLRPLGLDGRKKLQDLFVDKGIERSQRDTVPLVVDAMDRIVWVVGLTIDDTVQVTGSSRTVLFLMAKRLGGLG